jgi:hypothetical protein
METENTHKQSNGKKTFLILTIICSLFLVYYSVMSMIAPSRKMAELKKEFNPEKSEAKKVDNKLLSDSTYLRLIKERAMLQSDNGRDRLYILQSIG